MPMIRAMCWRCARAERPRARKENATDPTSKKKKKADVAVADTAAESSGLFGIFEKKKTGERYPVFL